MSHPVDQIRNIGIIAHIDAGKTTTTERILYYTGTTHRMGDVDHGNTTTDFDPEEAKRGITIYSAAVTCHWHDVQINIIDTPGHVDFTAEVERSLRVLDGGVVIFSAVEGVEAQSETVWRQANRYHVPRLCFINKMDRIGAGFERVLGQIRDRLRAHPLPISIPIGEGPNSQPDGFTGIIDLVANQALYFDSETKGLEIDARPIPEEYSDVAEQWRSRLLETLALLDDDAFSVYDETGDMPVEVIHRVLRAGTLSGQIQPTLCGSSLDYIGVQPLLDAVAAYLPSPMDMPPVEGTNPAPKRGKDAHELRAPDPKAPVAALVFKVLVDKHGELCMARVYSGVLKSRARLLNARTGGKELVNQLLHIQANERVQLDEAPPGEIVGIIGLKDTVTGDTLCDTHHPVLLEPISFPETVISMAVEPETSADRKKLEDALRLLGRQDPTFDARVSEDTGQTIISGMGELHLEVLRERLQRDFNLQVRVHKPRVSYRETVRNKAEVTGEFQRQTATAGQFASVTIRIEPFEGEQAVTVISRLKPDALPPELAAVVVRSLQDEARSGGTVGFPLMNVRITVLDAEYREGETTEVAVQAATAQAVREGLEKAGVELLEPIMRLEVVTPEDFLGNVQTDLSARRAMILSTDHRDHLVVVEAEAALARMFGYSTQVRSISQGRASYSMEPLKYAPAPPEVLENILG